MPTWFYVLMGTFVALNILLIFRNRWVFKIGVAVIEARKLHLLPSYDRMLYAQLEMQHIAQAARAVLTERFPITMKAITQ